MRKPVEPGSEARVIVDEELGLLDRVRAFCDRREQPDSSAPADYDATLIELRDQIADEKLEDLPSLVEQMTRVQAIAGGRRGKAAVPIDAASPYFAHLRLRPAAGSGAGSTDAPGASKPRDVLIGRRGLIDRAAGVQIVDWRDAPVSRVYYRYDEGDDYEEEVGASATLKGVVEARRNVTIAAGHLRRVGCPQGTFVGSHDGRWFSLEGQGVALLEGGQGTAARPPRQNAAPRPRGHGHGHGKNPRFEAARSRPASGDSKALPEIAALIDREQFGLITERSSGLVVIQGGAGSGKTTVALHRIAYLVFHDRAFKPSHCLFVVPSEALQRYVAGVLPALGVSGVPVVTFRSWARNLRRRLVPAAPDRYAEETPPQVSRLKKHPRLQRLLEDAVAAELAQARATLAEKLGDAPGAAWILKAWDERAPSIEPPVKRARRVRSLLERGKLDVPPPLAHRAEQVLRQLQSRLRDVKRIVFELMTDRARLEALRSGDVVEPARAGELDELVRWSAQQLDEELPPELDGIDAERLQPIDGQPLEASDQPNSRLDVEDDALLLRCYQLVHGALERTDGAPLIYDHIAVDEAQDLSAIELGLLYHALDERRSITIAGDTAQRVVFDNAFRGWPELLTDLGVAGAEARMRPLKLAYRSTAQVMRFARAVLGPLAAEDSGDVVAREGAEVTLHELGGMGEAVAFVADALRSLLGREPSASVALLTRHAGQADAWYGALRRAEVPNLRRVRRQDFAFQPGVDVTDASQVKGLEFDYVILLDVNQSSYPATVEARHLLHIGATRATHQLWLVATGPVSELVREACGEGSCEEEEAPDGAAALST
jgi:DNA helicase-2/ATP-dependent DNA helicase PcrA